MARTLVFRTNNVGSIPTGLIMKLTSRLLRYKTQSNTLTNRTVRYSLRFSSLVPPHLPQSQFSSSTSVTQSSVDKWRLTFKRSYAIVCWLAYLSSKVSSSGTRKTSVAILPRKRSIYTLTKAPMAHKTNSKEQYAFSFYNFTFSTTLLISESAKPLSVSQLAWALHLTKSLFPVFETNLFFLKYYKVEHLLKDSQYISLLK